MNMTNSIRRRAIRKNENKDVQIAYKICLLLALLLKFLCRKKNELFKCMKNYQIKMEVDHVKEIIRYILCERLLQLY